MENIKKDLFDVPIDEFHLTKVCSFKADSDSTESKQVTLDIRFKGATVNTLAQSCLSQGVVVKWQNGRARKDYDKIVDKSTVKIDWAAPAKAPQIDPKTAMIAEAQADGIDTSDKKAMSDWLKAKFNI